jgi:hypothetical protein
VDEAIAVHAGISAARLGSGSAAQVYERVNHFAGVIEFLDNQDRDHNHASAPNQALAKLKKLVQEISPQLELLAYLTCEALRRTHWELLADLAFAPLHYSLFVAGHGVHSVSVSELVPGPGPGGGDWRNLGALRTLPLSELLGRGLSRHLATIKDVTASALMQSMIEKTLQATTFCMNNSAAVLSADWLADPKLRDKIPFDFSRVVNISELSVLFQYCYKAVLVAEHTAVDMNIGVFDQRIGETKATLGNIIDFLKVEAH